MSKSRLHRLEPPRRLFLGTAGSLLALPWLGGCGPAKEQTPAQAASTEETDEARDVALLNEGIALEQGAIQVYTAAAGLPFIEEDPQVMAVAKLFMGQHEEHRDALTRMVQQLGGTPIALEGVPTPKIPAAVLDAAASPSDRKLATLRFARALERQAADTYFQLIVQQLRTDATRRLATEILQVEAQHGAVYDLVLGADAPVGAAFFTEQG